MKNFAFCALLACSAASWADDIRAASSPASPPSLPSSRAGAISSEPDGSVMSPMAPMNAVQSPAQMSDGMKGMSMQGSFGGYPMSREASGTSWQPDATPMDAIDYSVGEWLAMLHGYVDSVYDHQGGPRGAAKDFSESMVMVMGQRRLGIGTWALRGMFSLDPTIGKSGYPLLYGSGETADGKTPLIDRQHPHDLLMELSTSYSVAVTERSSLFGYAGLPGEPALGPPTFMHRFSGMDNPEAPISHHWFDSTHITYGVATLGYIWNTVKFEASQFRGREPDEFRYNIEAGKLDSSAARFSWNPSPEWSIQVSQGHLKSPEQLEPDINVDRRTASAIYQTTLFGDAPWGTTIAWGENRRSNGINSPAALVESTIRLAQRYTVFTRLETVANDELVQSPSATPQIQRVAKMTLGGIDDWYRRGPLVFGIGMLASRYAHGAALDAPYGHPTSYMIFARLKIIGPS